MAVDTISGVVYSKTPWLISPDDDTFVNDEICFAQIELQTALGKSETDVQDEGTYSDKEKLLTGYYTSYSIICFQALSNAGGESGSGGGAGEKYLSKVKADIVESEWKSKTEKDAGLNASYEKLKTDLQMKICRLASSMPVALELCAEFSNVKNPSDAGVAPFAFSCDIDPCC